MELGPHGFVVGEHVHLRQEERFTVLSGSVAFKLDGVERIATAGETVIAPAGTPHVWWNPGDQEARMLIEMRPALHFEEQMRTLYGLGRDGKTNAKGLPNVLQVAVFMHAYRDELAMAKPPLAVQRLVFGLLAPLGRLAGFRASYPAYTAPHRPASATTDVSTR